MGQNSKRNTKSKKSTKTPKNKKQIEPEEIIEKIQEPEISEEEKAAKLEKEQKLERIAEELKRVKEEAKEAYALQLKLQDRFEEAQAKLENADHGSDLLDLVPDYWIKFSSLRHPPTAVKLLFEALCLILQIPPVVKIDSFGNKVS